MTVSNSNTFNSRNAPKFVLRYHSKDIRDKMAVIAANNKRSLNSEMNEAMAQYVARAEGEGALTEAVSPVKGEEQWIPQENQLVLAPNGVGVIREFVWRNMKVYADVLLLGRRDRVLVTLDDLKPYKQPA